ncbi:MAG TPA: hypothetical protein VL614_25000 [Acetobacteraceae bacterium]|jgi:hypothetical protein|nr:hypothetical protein [Acetobacteraceae bacterium]
MSDEELIDACHAALRNYECAVHGNRVDAFVQLASAQMALIGRFGSSDYLQHYCRRHTVDTADLIACGVATDRSLGAERRIAGG